MNDGLSFDELWRGSLKFRRIFKHLGIASEVSDAGIAEAAWAARHPLTQWTFCGVDGCRELVHVGDACGKHMSPETGMPKWKWHQGILYKLVNKFESRKKRIRQHKKTFFARYDQHAWQGSFGKLPKGYVVRFIDGNPLNMRPGNLVALSKIAAASLDAGVLSIKAALALDSSIPEDIVASSSGGRPLKRWIYTVPMIAQYLGVRPSSLRRAISSGALDPSSLDSVLDYCLSIGDGPKKRWSYSYMDIARAAEVHVNSVRQASARETFYPDNLRSIVNYCLDSKKGGRKAATWEYTVKDIADMAGVAPSRVWEVIHNGKLDPSNLRSVVQYCTQRRAGTGESHGR